MFAVCNSVSSTVVGSTLESAAQVAAGDATDCIEATEQILFRKSVAVTLVTSSVQQ